MGNMGSMNPSEGMFAFYPDKVFPEEVDNIKDYMRDNFSTNVNPYSQENSSSGSGSPLIDRDTDGLIKVQPIQDNNDSKMANSEINQLVRYNSESQGEAQGGAQVGTQGETHGGAQKQNNSEDSQNQSKSPDGQPNENKSNSFRRLRRSR